MYKLSSLKSLRFACAAILFALICAPAVPAIKNMAVVTSAGSKLADVPLAELVKYCKGSPKAWQDGKSFVIVLKNPDLPEMRVALQKLFGGASEARIAIAKLNESRQAAIIVESDDDLLHAVDTTPGAVGIVDVYSINSSVKVLRVDGKLPFDAGYALKGN